MTCKIADNEPLKRLREDLDLPFQCHSFREHCAQGYERATGDLALGVPGAALGYCQALFNRQRSPDVHTEYVQQRLSEIGAPWANSHELYWGYRHEETASEFLQKGMRPLLGEGRVPILITGLDPAEDQEQIEEILETRPPVFSGETILIRVVLKSDKSIPPIVDVSRRLLEQTREQHCIPPWWPLIQGNLSVAQWTAAIRAFWKEWRYVNVAVNPFTPPEVAELLRDQITVAQIPVGLAEGIHSSGTIILPPGMKVSGASDGAKYNLLNFMDSLLPLKTAPTLIVLGPSSPEWPDHWNVERLKELLPILRAGVEQLWRGIGGQRREYMWKLRA